MTDLIAAVGRMTPVGLAQMVATAGLQTRRDRKYLVPVGNAEAFIDRLSSACRVLEIDGGRSFRYESVYFDSPDRASYLAAARRRPRRFKVRTRSYLDTGRCSLEIKSRNPRGWTVKVRQEHPFEDRLALGERSRAFLAGTPLAPVVGAALEPVLTSRYERSTLLVDGRSRVTIDVGVHALTADGRRVELVDTVVIETKTPGAPSQADRVLWVMGHRPVRVSKFCTGLAALHPELPSNRWTQALRQAWVVSDDPGPRPQSVAVVVARPEGPLGWQPPRGPAPGWSGAALETSLIQR